MRNTVAAKVFYICALPAALVTISCLTSNATLQIALIGIAQVAAIGLLSATLLRAHARLALRTQEAKREIADSRAKASTKEYEILQAISLAARTQTDVPNMLRSLEKQMTQLEADVANAGSILAQQDRQRVTAMPDEPNSTIDQERNRLAVQQLLTRLMGTQDEIARRLGKIESWTAANSGGRSDRN